MFSYGKIDNLYRSTGILEDDVVITEKIHGTNARFMFSSDKERGLVLGTRNNILYESGELKMIDGYGFLHTINQHGWEGIKTYPDYTFFGEFYGKGIQKGVEYSESKDIRIFDIMDPKGNYLNWEVVDSICKEVKFKTVPVLFKGKANLDILENLIDKNSIVAELNGIIASQDTNIAEGIVIKPLKMKKDFRGNWIRAKFKSDKWAENAKAPKTRRPNGNSVELQSSATDFADTVVTNGRVLTVIEHITREGNTELSVQRTGDFLRAFIKDVMEEYKELYNSLDKKEKNTYNKFINGRASALWQKYLINEGL